MSDPVVPSVQPSTVTPVRLNVVIKDLDGAPPSVVVNQTDSNTTVTRVLGFSERREMLFQDAYVKSLGGINVNIGNLTYSVEAGHYAELREHAKNFYHLDMQQSGNNPFVILTKEDGPAVVKNLLIFGAIILILSYLFFRRK